MPWTITVEVAFGYAPMDPNPTFTDITPWALPSDGGMQITRGAPDQFSQIQPSTLALALDNTDGRFTRFLTTGAYYPNVKNGVRIRVKDTYTPKNWVTNPTFDVDISGWAAGGSVPPTLAYNTTVVHSGAGSLQITWGTDGTFPQAATTLSNLRIGQIYTASAWLRTPSAPGGPFLKLAIAGGPVGSPTNALDTWQQRTVTFTATATSHSLQVWPDTAPTAGQIGRVDDVQVEEGTTATTFDGTPPVTTTLFDGHVNEWPTEWAALASYAETRITATDRSKRFSARGELRSMLEEEVLYDAGQSTSELMPLEDRLFSTTVGNWTATTGGSISRVTSPTHAGVGALQFSGSGAGTPEARDDGGTFGSAAAVTPGDVVTISTWMRGDTVPRGWRVVLRWLTSGNGLVAADAGPYVTNTVGVWTHNVYEWRVAPATAAKVIATIQASETIPSGELHYFDDFSILKYVGTPSVAAYYPLSEPTDAASAASVAKQLQDNAVIKQIGSGGTVSFGSGTGPGTDQLPAPLFAPASASAGLYLEAALQNGVGGGGGITLECWFRADSGIVSRRIVEAAADAGSSFGDLSFNSLQLNINASGFLQASRYIGVNAYILDDTNRVVNDGKTHHGVITESISGSTITARLFLDGAEEFNTTYTYDSIMVAGRLFVGGRPNNVGGYGVFSGTISHVACYGAALANARLSDHYHAGTDGLAGERTDQRIGRVANWIGIPVTARAYDVGASTVGWQSTSGRQPLEVMREVEVTEQGRVFFAGNGNHTFHSRSRRYNAAVAITLQGVDAALTIPGDDIAVRNDITVTRPKGAQARSVNQASIDAYGLARDTLDIAADTDAAARALANWTANNSAEPKTRVPNVTAALHELKLDAPSQVPLLIAADISTKLRLASLPTQAPTSTIDLFVEGMSMVLDWVAWTITFNTSPSAAYDVWQLGVAGYSELGVTTKLAY